MPNHITNIIKMRGLAEDVQLVIDRFGTYHSAKIDMTYDNKEWICKPIDGVDSNIEVTLGWFNPKTGIFRHRGVGDGFPKGWIEYHGLPKGWSPVLCDSYLHFPDFEKVLPPPKDDPAYNDLPTQQDAEHSPNWWYTWNSTHWGTKWNSYKCRFTGVATFEFKTAWDHVLGIILTMAKAYPNVEFRYKWASEDTGQNVGECVVVGGVIVDEYNPEPGSKEAYELAFTVHPTEAQYYSFVDGEYVYVEE